MGMPPAVVCGADQVPERAAVVALVGDRSLSLHPRELDGRLPGG